MGRKLSMAFKMFRYLNKYVGKYRVLPRYDLSTMDFPRDENGNLDESFDDLYIPCRRGEIRHSYRDTRGYEVLCWYTDSATQGKNVYNELSKDKDLWLEVDDIDQFDYFIYFNANDIEKIAAVVEPKTSGAKITPFSSRNLPKTPYEIPEADLAEYKKAIDGLEMLDVLKLYKDFEAEIPKIKGKGFDLKQAKINSHLKGRALFHSIGVWSDFIKFIQERR